MLQAIRSSTAGIVRSLSAELSHGLSVVPLRTLATLKPSIRTVESVKPLLSDVAPASCKLVYDGSCPTCRMTVENINIEGAVLVNARKGSDPTVSALEKQGYDFDKGMALVEPDGTVHFGADAVAAMGEKKGGIFKTILSSDFTRKHYTFLRSVRDALVPESIAAQHAREVAEDIKKPTFG